ncbi:hypothetical protein QJS10_CPA03g01413 [Acorus calamus]|uniref:Reverse transcriptase zinc-binding domain-containing protein n=1 Tax=Acorus calamus TaxID=4465 RepID=A0AAV9F609_ACOCL|nr:hypothetical protein QJS10_CPA03g01413 [Acorus calamus]
MWCRIVEARYRVGGDLANRFPRVSPRVSRIWHNILTATAQFSPAIRWKVGDGRTILFWHDHWLGDGPLNIRYQRIFVLSVAPLGRVCHFKVSQGPNCIWSINLSRELSWEDEVDFSNILLELFLVEFNDPLPDKALWSPQPRLGFSVRSCYKWVRRDHPPLQATAMKWREISGPKIPLKVKAFVWLMFQERILTKTYRAKWSLQADILCPMCESAEETSEHLFITCSVARQL